MEIPPSLHQKKKDQKKKLWEKAEWLPQCEFLMEGIVKNPKQFCGAFWQDKKQWYHGPVKTDLAFLKRVKEQIEIFPEFYEELKAMKATLQVVLEQLSENTMLLKSRVDVLNELDKKEMILMNGLIKREKLDEEG